MEQHCAYRTPAAFTEGLRDSIVMFGGVPAVGCFGGVPRDHTFIAYPVYRS